MKTLIFLTLLTLAASQEQNMEKAVTRIQGVIAEMTAHPPNFTAIPVLIAMVLPCLEGMAILKVEDNNLPENLVHYIENVSPKSLAEDLQKVDWAEISNVKAPYRAAEGWDDWRKFMGTSKFEKIHNHLWNNKDNIQYKRILHFIEGSGYPQLFANIKKFYTDMGRDDLTKDISGTFLARQHDAVQGFTRKAGSGFPFVTMKRSSIYADDEEKCPGGIIGLLPELLRIVTESNLIQLLNVVLYILQEVLGNHAMHVFMMTVGEPATGQAVQELFTMPEMTEFMPLLEHLVFTDKGITGINEVIKLAVGIDVSNPAIFKYIVNLILYLVWGIPFP